MSPKKNAVASVLELVVEAGMLKQTARSGWQVAGIKGAESVADHSFRCAFIGYALASMEGVSAYRVLLMTLFGDLQEARTGDLHKMAQTYIPTEGAEDEAFFAQIKDLPGGMSRELAKARREYRAQKTKESIIARDADILECLIQAKEYYEQGFLQAKKLTRIAPRFLKTASARAVWRKAKSAPLNDWWLKLATFTR
ncbi:HD family hydrolase [Candidatus Omnitrophota bacterium]